MTVGGDLSSAVSELSRLDSSRLTYGVDYSVNLQVPCAADPAHAAHVQRVGTKQDGVALSDLLSGRPL